MKRPKLDMDNEELEEWINNLSACIKKEYNDYKKRGRKFNKIVRPLLSLLESRGYNSSVIRYSNC